MTEPLASYRADPARLDEAIAFVRRTRAELRTLRKVRLWPDHLHIIDVNKDVFELLGIGYAHPDVQAILDEVNAAYDPRSLPLPVADFKEYDTGRRYPWAQDRVM